MRGGTRKGAGRKALKKSNKKKNRNVCMADDLYNEIMETKIEGIDNFSQKCQYLIKEGLKQYSVKKEDAEEMDSKLKFIDLFAGIGGIRKGFEDQDTVAVFSSEWDKYAAKTYKANYGDEPYGDITKIKEEDIPEHDVLLAGFPCQPFSNIGKREGFEHETQGTLFFDVLRILRYHLPKMFLLENVTGLLTIQGGKTFQIILSELEKSLQCFL